MSGENVSQNLVHTAYSRSRFGGLQRAEVKKLDYLETKLHTACEQCMEKISVFYRTYQLPTPISINKGKGV